MKTKETYQIGELSKLYGIGTDSLRYYEKIGILNPKRGVNNYRMYNISDIITLNILRELRAIGFSLKEIKAHLADFNLDKTLALFEKEIVQIDQKTAELAQLKTQLVGRIKEIESHMSETQAEQPLVKKLAERRILKLSEDVYRDEDVDFIIKKLQKENENQIYIIGNSYLGATIPLAELEAGHYGHFTSVFFITEKESYDQVIPAGNYLSMVVKGGYGKMPKAWNKLFRYIEEKSMKVAGDPMELYIIDNHATGDEDEFVTELQILLK